MKPRILFCDDAVPGAGLGYGFPRALSILRGLVRAGAVVDFLALQDLAPPPPARLRELNDTGARLAGGEGESIARSLPALARRVPGYDLVWVSRRRNLAPLREAGLIGGNASWVFDAEAVTAPRDAELARARGHDVSPAAEENMLAAEVAEYRDAPLVVCAGPRDREFIRLHRTAPVEVLPGELALPSLLPPFAERSGILFVNGNYPRHPTQRVVNLLVGDILPRVRRRKPLALSVAGFGTDTLRLPPGASRDGLTMLGFVPELSPLYARARLFVIPTLIAGGLPWKGLEAMAHGLPLVVSPLIAAQLAPFSDMHVAADPGDFAEVLAAAHDNPDDWRRMSKAGREFVSEFAGKSAMDRVCREVVGRARAQALPA